ncbi:nuclear receptor subfamily 1 group I member 2 S homeolog isoform X1 [Xenopus laevis]|uniref:Nuclear receptor subfamily 1 group I member 2 S homeolog isoform X1 n=1 Tax=Xenopus laevis TaxID=8355 RepID=A0A8J1MC85_XENLA|nr:nuclear receptor subfamily 1 group I member 2 S homeolog isoform X1 [Xenopus laevis]
MSEVQEAVVLEEEEEEEEDPCNSCGTGEDEDDGEPKICRACGDRATGYHFNAMTCEGCKGFFRRAMKRNLRLSCPFQNSCVINKNNRRHCQACRLKKCLDIGMRKELIMSDEAVEQRRALIKRKQNLSLSPPTPPGASLTPEQQHFITELVEAHTKTFDFNFTFFKNFRPIRRSPDPTQDPQATSSEAFLMLPHISDLFTYMLKGVISFAKMLPYFRMFNPKTNTWECGAFTYNADDMTMAGFSQQFLEPLLRIHCMMTKLNLESEAYALMATMALFSSDRPGVSDCEKIQNLQEHIALMLKAFIESHRPPSPQNRLLYPKIMECLTELRTINDIHSKQLMEIWDIQPDVTPLMREVFGSLNE